MRSAFAAALVLLILSLQVTAQRISFKRVVPPKSFPFALIGGMAQDSLGYMWFTSSAVLYRYDGYEYKTYTNDPLNPQTIDASNLESIYIDREGYIWIGDIFNGLNRMDPGTGIFTHYVRDSATDNGLSHNHVTAISEDDEGNIWVGTVKGLDVLDKKTGKFRHYRHNPRDSSSLSFEDVGAIYRDRSGTMWVGTGGAFKNDKDPRGGLNRFDPKTGKFTRYVHDPSDPQTLIDNRVRSLLEDSKGNFWVGTAGKDGLHLMDRKTGKFTRYLYDPAHPDKLSRPPQKKSVPYADDHITFISEDSTGAIWIGTFEGGLNRYDPQTQKITHYAASNKSDSLQENGVWSMYSSRDGMIWLGSWELGAFNLYKMDPMQKEPVQHDIGYSISCFYEDPAHNLYFGGYGFGLLNKEKQIVKHYLNATGAVSLPSGVIFIICANADKNGIIWIGTGEGGVYSFDPETKRFTQFKHDPAKATSITGGSVSDVLEDRLGQLWVSTTDGLNKMDRRTGNFTHFLHDSTISRSLACDLVLRLYQTRSGEVWVGTAKGIDRLDIRNNTFEHFIPTVVVLATFEDAANTLWVATDKGLYFKQQRSNTFVQYTDKNFLPDQLVVTSLIEDNDHNLFVSSVDGLYILDPQRRQSTFYNISEKWATTLTPFMAVHKTQTGQLLYGNPRGIIELNPRQYTQRSRGPQFEIANVKISNKEAGGRFKSQEVHLDYYQNSFSFSFSAIHFRKPEENKHMYMLEGYDNAWRKTGSEHTASYFSVPPGTYTLRVAASSSNGVWTEKTVKIVITPPWWSTWWFRIAAIVTVLGIFYAIVRWRVQQKFNLQLERSEKDKQLADLRHKTSELEIHALRAQMNPHFIFNSLNSINRFILQNNKTQASEYLTKFSKLVRLVFQNAQAALVSLDSELEALSLYLELEALRFDNHFQYTVTVGEEVDASAMKVPPLIIQPYAENAIWHGLMHKEEKGHLDIELFIEQEVLVCRIKDDGIGRKKAAEIKSKSNSTHKSMGMRITADRIALLQQQKLIHAAIQINDLVLPDGRAAGTEIILKLPVRYD